MRLTQTKSDDRANPIAPEFPSRYVALILFGFVFLALAVRYWYTMGQSITCDEYYEVDLAKTSITEILYRGDGFPPLYSLILFFWQSLFGDHAGIQSARALSMLFGAACVPAIYFTARRAACPKSGIVAAGLIAILPVHCFYTSEARAYALLVFLTCVAVNAALRAIEEQTPWAWCRFAIWATLGMYTHYLFACFVGTVLLVGLIQGRDWWTVMSGAIVLLLSLPLILFWAEGDFNQQQSWVHQIPFGLGELLYTYAVFIFGYTIGPSTRELHPMTFREAFVLIAPYAAVVAASGLTLVMTAKRRLPDRPSTPLLLCLVVAPALTGMACMTFDVGYQVRYVVWSSIPALVFLSYIIVQAFSMRAGKIAVAALISVMILASVNRSAFDRYRNEDLKAVSDYLNESPDRHRPMIVVSGYMVDPFRYYLDEKWTLVRIPSEREHEPEVAFDEIVEELIKPSESLWFVYSREFHDDPDGNLLQKIQSVADLKLEKEVAGVKVYLATGKASQG